MCLTLFLKNTSWIRPLFGAYGGVICFTGRYASRLTGLLDLRSADHVSTSICSSSCNNSMLCREARTRLALNTQVQDTVSGRGVFSNVPSSMPRTATWRMMGLVWPVIQIIQLISLAMLGSNLIQTLWVIQPKNPSCALCIHFFISSTCPENICRCADIRTWSSALQRPTATSCRHGCGCGRCQLCRSVHGRCSATAASLSSVWALSVGFRLRRRATAPCVSWHGRDWAWSLCSWQSSKKSRTSTVMPSVPWLKPRKQCPAVV